MLVYLWKGLIDGNRHDQWKVTTVSRVSRPFLLYPSLLLPSQKNAQEKEIQYRLRTELVCYWFDRQLKIALSSFKSPKLCYRQEWHRMSHGECQGHGAMIHPAQESRLSIGESVLKFNFFFFFFFSKFLLNLQVGRLPSPASQFRNHFFPLKAIFFYIKPPNLHMAKIPYMKSKGKLGANKRCNLSQTF